MRGSIYDAFVHNPRQKFDTDSELSQCGGCRSSSLKITFDFGRVPLAGYFPSVDETLIPPLPMKLMQCENCELYQISPDLSDTELFSDYRYVSSIGMQRHFDELALWFVSTQKPKQSSRIVEFGCNDGPLLTALSSYGFDAVGIDPAKNIVELARKKGLRVINDFFGREALSKYTELQEVDFIFSSNSFAHITDIYAIAETISKSLAPDGRFIVEVQSFVSILEKNAFDFIYHEHKYYYTLKSISSLLNQFGLNLLEHWSIPTHGGSYRLVFGKTSKDINVSVIETLSREEEFLERESIAERILRYRSELNKVDEYLQKQYELGKKLIAFGASGRGNMLLADLPNTRRILPAVLDESPERISRLMAQNGVPVADFNQTKNRKYDVVLVLAWNHLDAIISKWGNRDCVFVVPLPNFKIISVRSHKEK